MIFNFAFFNIICAILHRRREELLKNIEKRLHTFDTIFNNFNFGVIYLDFNGNIIYLNEYFQNIFYGNNKIMGKNIFMITKKENNDFIEYIKNALTNKEEFSENEVEILDKEDEKHNIIFNGFVLEKTKDEDAYYVVSFFDITKLKRIEREFRNEKIKAEEANKTKGQFLANISHELRTPLNGIIGMIESLGYLNLSEELNKKFQIIRRSGETLLKIINDILDLSKIESGKFRLEDVEFDIKDSLIKIIELVRVNIKNKPIELLYYFSPKIPKLIIGDSLRLNQVITNLLNNAIKFTEKGEVIISIDVISIDDNNVKVSFVIEDTGIGIAKDKYEKLFKTFSQVDNSHSRKYGGTGLGLVISKDLVEIMGGEIEVQSEYSKGSKFSFELEFAIKEKSKGKIIKDVELILIEENKNIGNFLLKIFNDWKVPIIRASSSEEAIEIFEDPEIINDKTILFIEGHFIIKNKSLLSKINELKLKDRSYILPRNKSEIVFFESFIFKNILPRPLVQDTIFRILTGEVLSKVSKTKEVAIYENFKALKVLIVEDNLVNIEVFKEFMNVINSEYDVAMNASQTLKIIEEKDFDLILMDIQLPKLNGFELTKILRKRQKDKGEYIPIIAVSAHSSKGYREKCIKFGMDDYISKPIIFDKLLTVIKKIFNDNIVNMEEVKRRYNNRDDIFMKVLNTLLEIYPEALNRIEKAIKTNNSKDLEHEAHSLKGAVSNISAEKLTELLKMLEEIGMSNEIRTGFKGEIEGAENILEKIKLEFSKLEEMFKRRDSNENIDN